MRKAKCDCRKCCFDLIPEEVGGHRSPLTLDPVGGEVGDFLVPVTKCYLSCYGPQSRYPSEELAFTCQWFVNRGTLERAWSKRKLCQFKEVHINELSGKYKEILEVRWSQFDSVITYGISKLPEKLRDALPITFRHFHPHHFPKNSILL